MTGKTAAFQVGVHYGDGTYTAIDFQALEFRAVFRMFHIRY